MKITSDAHRISFLLPGEWDAAEFLGIPGTVAWIHNSSVVVGMIVEDTLFIEKIAIYSKEDREIMFDELRRQFKSIFVDLSLEKKDHRKIIELYDQGFSAEANGEMQIRMMMDGR